MAGAAPGNRSVRRLFAQGTPATSLTSIKAPASETLHWSLFSVCVEGHFVMEVWERGKCTIEYSMVKSWFVYFHQSGKFELVRYVN